MDEQQKLNEFDHPDGIAQAVLSNGQRLERLLEQFAALREQLSEGREANELQEVSPSPDREFLNDQILDYKTQIEECQRRIVDLEEQNRDLATRVAGNNVRQTVASGSGDALSWEDRKKLILQQMEAGSFDAATFAKELGPDDANELSDPVAHVRRLHDDIASVRDELQRRDAEIHELRSLLDAQSGACDGGVAIGAATIAEMVDADEMVQHERSRLQRLQDEWEQKFRQGEIEASLERAKLSRERLELARNNAELEERLEHLRREADNHEAGGHASRRWMTKLGLND